MYKSLSIKMSNIISNYKLHQWTNLAVRVVVILLLESRFANGQVRGTVRGFCTCNTVILL